jgi:hypothetical protein
MSGSYHPRSCAVLVYLLFPYNFETEGHRYCRRPSGAVKHT